MASSGRQNVERKRPFDENIVMIVVSIVPVDDLETLGIRTPAQWIPNSGPPVYKQLNDFGSH